MITLCDDEARTCLAWISGGNVTRMTFLDPDQAERGLEASLASTVR